MSEIELERMRSPEIRERLDAGWTTAVFACGAIEQHGPHLPLFVDTEHGSALAVAVARKLSRALVAPTIRVGCSEHHMAFAGTLSLSRETFEAVVTDYVTSLARHGFDTIRVVPSHGGNFAPLRDMQDRLAAAAPNADVKCYTDVMGLMGSWKRVVEREDGCGERVGGHADYAETSILLALHPELVATELAEPGLSTDLDDEVIGRIIADGFDSVTPNGILGDPRGAHAVLGRKLIDAFADEVVRAFQSD